MSPYQEGEKYSYKTLVTECLKHSAFFYSRQPNSSVLLVMMARFIQKKERSCKPKFSKYVSFIAPTFILSCPFFSILSIDDTDLKQTNK